MASALAVCCAGGCLPCEPLPEELEDDADGDELFTLDDEDLAALLDDSFSEPDIVGLTSPLPTVPPSPDGGPVHDRHGGKGASLRPASLGRSPVHPGACP